MGDNNGGVKLSGVEMMLRTVLRALGIDPAETMAAIERFRTALPEFANRADERLKSIDERLAAIESRLKEEQLTNAR
jgi:hypothetical protein